MVINSIRGTTLKVASMLQSRIVVGGRSERGDLPGWVLITVMTAALVAAVWAFAGNQLEQAFRDAINDALNAY